MVKFMYASYPVKASEKTDNLALACLSQDTETLYEIQDILGDKNITQAHFETKNGDIMEQLHISYISPSFERSSTLERITQYDNIEEYLLDVLPHGSGIDSDWHIIVKDNKVIANNSYHAMDEYGMYTDWIDFKVYMNILKDNRLNHNFEVTKVTLGQKSLWMYDDDGHKYNDIPLIRDYLNDLFERFI